MSDSTRQNPVTPAAEDGAPARSCVGNRLRNGTIGGNPASAPRCGAKNRRGVPCMGATLRGKKRCKHHGGASTGPRSAAGLARIVAARSKHGAYGAEFGALIAQLRRIRVDAALLTAQHIAAQRDAKACATAAPANSPSTRSSNERRHHTTA